jgi:hypothetical protein
MRVLTQHEVREESSVRVSCWSRGSKKQVAIQVPSRWVDKIGNDSWLKVYHDSSNPYIWTIQRSPVETGNGFTKKAASGAGYRETRKYISKDSPLPCFKVVLCDAVLQSRGDYPFIQLEIPKGKINAVGGREDTDRHNQEFFEKFLKDFREIKSRHLGISLVAKTSSGETVEVEQLAWRLPPSYISLEDW